MSTHIGWKILLGIAYVILFWSPSVNGQSNLSKARESLERARSYSAWNDPRAEHEYRQAIAARKGVYPEAWEGLSSYLARQQRFYEAAQAGRKYFTQVRRKPWSVEVNRQHRLERAAELKARSDRGDIISGTEMVELVRLVEGFCGKGAALPYAESAVKLHPESTEALIALARLLRWEKKDRSLELLNRAIAFEPNDPEMYVERGSFYFWAHHDPFEAEADFRRALQLSEGSNAPAWGGLGDSLARQGRLKEAIAAYRKYLSIRPKSLSAHDGMVKREIEKLKDKSQVTTIGQAVEK